MVDFDLITKIHDFLVNLNNLYKIYIDFSDILSTPVYPADMHTYNRRQR